MCLSIGVDPLRSNTVFSKLNVELARRNYVFGSEKYFSELGIQIVETCMLFEDMCEALIDLKAVSYRISLLREQEISELASYFPLD